MIKTVNLSEIIIPNNFLTSKPSDVKVANIEEQYKNGCDIGKDIYISENNKLIDGYIRYIVLLNHGEKYADVNIVNNQPSYRNKSTTYVYGKHFNNGKMYVWRATKKTMDINNLAVGNIALVSTKKGNKLIVINKIENLDTPPVETAVRRVIKCFKKQE